MILIAILKNYKKAYQSIKDQGFKSHKELGKLLDDDVRVMIDRSGKLLLGAGGNHRFAIAKLLKIQTIPVLVDTVHYLWAKECLLKYGGSFSNAIKQGLLQYDCRFEKSIYKEMTVKFKVKCVLSAKLRRVKLLDITRNSLYGIRRVLYYLNVFAFIHLLLFTVFARLNIKRKIFTKISRRYVREHLQDDLLMCIKPDQIRYDWVRRRIFKKFVENSCWDEDVKPIQTLKSVQQLFVEKIDYKKTEQYLKMKKAMEAGEVWNSRECETLEDIDHYFESLLKVYESIKCQGFKSQKELGKLRYDDVRVMIDRSGKLLLGSGGNHRFAIAKLLKIQTIPVLVDTVHYLWAKECLLKYGGSFSNAIKKGLRQYDCRYGSTQMTRGI